MDNDISAVTGLPEAPEGMFWRVCERTEDRFYNYRYGYAVELIRSVTIISRKDRRILGIKFGMTDPVTERHDEVIDYAWLEVDDVRSPTTDDSNDDVEKGFVETKRGVYLREITPELIRDAALDIINKREANEAGKKLLGDYPPKTLVEKTDD